MQVKIGNYRRNSRRKVSINVDNSDVWNLDNTLAYIIYPCLLQLKTAKKGLPGEFAEVGGEDYESQYSFDFYKPEPHLLEQKYKEWDIILDKMIWSFKELMKGNYTDLYTHGVTNIEFVETERLYPNPISGKLEKTYKMVEKEPHKNWTDYEGIKEHEKRIQEGLDLFAKYYRNLWD